MNEEDWNNESSVLRLFWSLVYERIEMLSLVEARSLGCEWACEKLHVVSVVKLVLCVFRRRHSSGFRVSQSAS